MELTVGVIQGLFVHTAFGYWTGCSWTRGGGERCLQMVLSFLRDVRRFKKAALLINEEISLITGSEVFMRQQRRLSFVLVFVSDIE